MIRTFRYIGYLIFLGLPFIGKSQKPEAKKQIEAIIESVADEMEEEPDASLVIEDMEDFILEPLNINTASYSQLSRLHLLNEIQIKQLIEYRDKYGPVLSIFELNAVDGLNPEILSRMQPFIWFGPEQEEPIALSQLLKYGRHEVLLRTLGTVQKSRGYIRQEDGTIPYAGNRFRYYSRYRFQSYDKLSVGLLAEKDPGEAFFAGQNSKGFDFYSGHISFWISPFFQNLTVGDFIVRSGQGLVVWQGFSLGKSVYSLNLSKTNQGIRPYTSSDENQFFRGVATTISTGNSRFSFFVSKKMRDGNRVFPDSAGTCFSSLQSSGYHRTDSEIDDKNSINDFNTGMLGHWQSGNLKLGAVFIYSKFGLPYLPPDQLYNRFYFRGTDNYTTGIDYLFSKGKYQLYGEAAVSKSGGKAVVQGATAYLHDRIQLSALFRHFDKNYHALWASPVAESSSANNETGFYTGTRILPVRHVTISAYSDFYRSGWIKYTTAGPSTGYDVFAQADYNPPGRFQLYLRYKNEEKERKFRLNEKNINLPEQVKKGRLNIQYNASETIILRTRFEYVSYKGHKDENGKMVIQDVQFAPAKLPLNLSARVAWFDTDGYNSRIYAYENDLLYAFAIPACFGRGMRTYVNLKYRLSEQAEVWIKMADTCLKGTESIGTGYDQITGNHKTELKFQIRLKL